MKPLYSTKVTLNTYITLSEDEKLMKIEYQIANISMFNIYKMVSTFVKNNTFFFFPIFADDIHKVHKRLLDDQMCSYFSNFFSTKKND